MLFDHKIEKITDPQTRDKIQAEFENLCCILFILLENKYMKDVHKITHKSLNRPELSV